MSTSPDRSGLRSTGRASRQTRLVPQFRADVSARHAFPFPSPWTGQRLAVETWLQRNGVITITQNKKVLPVFLEQFAHN
jgi:hypothetical protein